MPKGSFYHHFSSKEDFARCARPVCRSRGRACGKRPERLEVATVETSEALLHLSGEDLRPADRRFPDACWDGSVWRWREKSELNKQISASFAGWQHKIAAVVEQAAEQKTFPEIGSRSRWRAFAQQLGGAMPRSQAEKSNAALETFMHYAFDVLLKKKASG